MTALPHVTGESAGPVGKWRVVTTLDTIARKLMALEPELAFAHLAIWNRLDFCRREGIGKSETKVGGVLYTGIFREEDRKANLRGEADHPDADDRILREIARQCLKSLREGRI